MELRIKESVRKILLAYPGAKHVAFKGFHGLRTEQDEDGRLDTLGFDAFLHLDNDNELKVQVKCGTKENFERWGAARCSFTLGDPNDIFMKRIKDTPVQFYDLFLTGYEIEKGQLSPYALISWPQLIKRVFEGHIVGPDDTRTTPGQWPIHIEKNSKGQQFCWLSYERVIMGDICLTRQFDIKVFDTQRA